MKLFLIAFVCLLAFAQAQELTERQLRLMYDLSTPRLEVKCVHNGYTSKVLLETLNVCTVVIKPESNDYVKGFDVWTTDLKRVEYSLETSIWKDAPDDCTACVTNVVEPNEEGSFETDALLPSFSFVWNAPQTPEPDVEGLVAALVDATSKAPEVVLMVNGNPVENVQQLLSGNNTAVNSVVNAVMKAAETFNRLTSTYHADKVYLRVRVCLGETCTFTSKKEIAVSP